MKSNSRSLSILVATWIASACTQNLTPGNTSISCASDAECISGFRCDQTDRVCVPTQAIPTPPTVTLTRTEPERRIVFAPRFEAVVEDSNGDRVRLRAEWRLDQGAWQSATTSLPAGEVVANGAPIEVRWDAARDLGSELDLVDADLTGDGTSESVVPRPEPDPAGARPTVSFRLTANDGNTSPRAPVAISGIEIGNQVANLSLPDDFEGSRVSDDVFIPVEVVDVDNDPVTVEVEFAPATDGSALNYSPVTLLFGTTDQVIAGPEAVAVVVWSSRSPAPGGVGESNREGTLRFRAVDFGSETPVYGPWLEARIRVQNRNLPEVYDLSVPRSLFAGGTAVAPVRFTLADAESDIVDLSVEYSTNSGQNWIAATEYPGPHSSGLFSLPTRPRSDGGLRYRFDWDPRGVFLAPPENVLVRVRATDGGGAFGSATTGLAETPEPQDSALELVDAGVACPDGSSTSGVLSGDVVDGAPVDLILACNTALRVYPGVSIGGGSVAFDPPIDSARSGGGLHRVFIAELDGTSGADLVAVGLTEVEIWSGNGTGSFTLLQSLSVDADEYHGFVADDDDDGDLDLFLSGTQRRLRFEATPTGFEPGAELTFAGFESLDDVLPANLDDDPGDELLWISLGVVYLGCTWRPNRGAAFRRTIALRHLTSRARLYRLRRKPRWPRRPGGLFGNRRRPAAQRQSETR